MKKIRIFCLFAACFSFTTTEKQLHLKLRLFGDVDHGRMLYLSANTCKQFGSRIKPSSSDFIYIKNFNPVASK